MPKVVAQHNYIVALYFNFFIFCHFFINKYGTPVPKCHMAVYVKGKSYDILHEMKGHTVLPQVQEPEVCVSET